MEPVTEASNPITSNIDLADPSGILKLLSQCDMEIFSGWRLHQSLYDEGVLRAISDVANVASSVIMEEKGLVVLSGCGTSGRLAFVIARTFNLILNKYGKEPKFDYTIAGGDRALLLSTEAPEDSWMAGVKDLETATREAIHVLFIGITCGLSAPYVAGQLEYCINHSEKYTSVLLGFNPVELARKVPISNWDKTFHDIASSMEELARGRKHCFIINPVVGPEPITGSSRMKSGSATKMILEAIFYIALNSSLCDSNLKKEPFPVEKVFQAYEYLCRDTYLHSKDIAKLLERAGYSLCNGGRVCYLGKDNLGIMSIIDASECPPTYGSSPDDIRGFIEGGWDTLHNKEGDLSSRGSQYQLSITYFEKYILPCLSNKDTIIFVTGDEQVLSDSERLLTELGATNCYTGLITTATKIVKPSSFKHALALPLPMAVVSSMLSPVIDPSLLPHMVPTFSEMSIKWSLNAISTGAHIMKGKVLGNRMVDLQVSNSKLYHRALGIIQKLAGVDSLVAREKLLTSIHGSTSNSSSSSLGIPEHIEKATGQEMVVPKAILMACSGCTKEEAEKRLRVNPVVRKVLCLK